MYKRIEAHFISGDLLTAQTEAQEAHNKFSNIDPEWDARFRIQLAKVYLYRGENEKVRILLGSAFRIGVDPELNIWRHLVLALANVRLHRYANAHEELAAAVELHPTAAMHAEVLAVQGGVALTQGEHEKAQSYFEKALDEARVYGSTYLETRISMNLGVIALQQEHYEDARGHFQHASTLAQSIGARQALEVSLGNLSRTYFQTGDFTHSRQVAEAAAKEAHALGATFDEVLILINLGISQFADNDLEAARSSYQRALELAGPLNTPDLLQNAHTALAYLFLKQQPDVAAIHIEKVASLARASADPTDGLEPLLLESLLLIQQGYFPAAESRLLNLVKQSNAAPSFQWEAENTLAGLYDKIGNAAKAEVWYRRAIGTFHQQRLTLKSLELQLPFLENGNDLYLGYIDHLVRQHRPEDALRVLDQSRAETLAEGLGTSSKGNARETTPRALAAKLHGTILVYCLRPHRSYLWAVDGKREEFHELLGSEEILPLVKRHTEAILASKDLLAQQDAPGAALYDAMVRPAEPLLTPGGRIFLIADKGLGGLNFETLIVPGQQPHYWIEDASVTNARSLRLLGTMNASPLTSPSPQKQRMLLIGDPIYRQQEYAPLPNAAAEMKGVASHFDQAERTVFAGKEASPTTYTTSDAKRFAYIHFVAHATADAINPLDSAIILSNSGDRLTPYKLYAADILRQPLNAELVTLSSCYGSGVRNYSGEGVVGLVWAFLRAGAHYVIGAMWEVSDVSTPQLMDSLYGELLRGAKPDAALRSAKLTMVHQRGVFRKPLYWASFQLYAGR